LYLTPPEIPPEPEILMGRPKNAEPVFDPRQCQKLHDDIIDEHNRQIGYRLNELQALVYVFARKEDRELLLCEELVQLVAAIEGLSDALADLVLSSINRSAALDARDEIEPSLDQKRQIVEATSRLQEFLGTRLTVEEDGETYPAYLNVRTGRGQENGVFALLFADSTGKKRSTSVSRLFPPISWRRKHLEHAR
jgi:hypothetical protein